MLNNKRERVKVPITIKKKAAEISIPAREWNEQTRRDLKPWYITALEGEICVLFFVKRIHLLFSRGAIQKRALNKAISDWFKETEVNRAIKSEYLTEVDIDELVILIAYYPEITAKIKKAYKKQIRMNKRRN